MRWKYERRVRMNWTICSTLFVDVHILRTACRRWGHFCFKSVHRGPADDNTRRSVGSKKKDVDPFSGPELDVQRNHSKNITGHHVAQWGFFLFVLLNSSAIISLIHWSQTIFCFVFLSAVCTCLTRYLKVEQ